MFLGTFEIDDFLTFVCNTHTPSTGAATDADSAPSYRIYEDETATPLLTGSMAKLDDANTTGFYSERVQLTAANGFEKSKSYSIYISATVGGVTGTTAHSFNIHALADYKADVSALATAANLQTVDDNVDAILLDTGTDGVVLADDAITAAKIAANAIGASELAADAVTEIGTGVWVSATRTLTQAAAAVAAAVSGSAITAIRGDTLSATLTGLGSLADRSKLWFTAKRDVADADTAAIIQIEETAGLLYFNGAPGTAGNGTLVVNDETTGSITITVKASDMAELTAMIGTYDVQKLNTSGVISTLTKNTFTVDVATDQTRATS